MSLEIYIWPGCTMWVSHSWWLSGKESTCNAGAKGDVGSIPGSGRFPGGRHGNPVQYSCLENPMDRRLVGYSLTGLRRIGHDWGDWACTHHVSHRKVHWRSYWDGYHQGEITFLKNSVHNVIFKVKVWKKIPFSFFSC